MTLKKRLALTIVIMLVTPALIIALLTAVMLAGMAISDRLTIAGAIVQLATDDGGTPSVAVLGLFALWLGVSLAVLLVSISIGIFSISRRILAPMRELTRAAQRIRDGELEFEVLTSNDAEVGRLCTAFDDMRRRLRDSVSERLESERQRNLMLAHISHDLRTPVTSIKGYVEGLRDGVAATHDMQARYLNTIHTKAGAMQRMIEQMSDFSELELGRMKFDFAPMVLADFLDELGGEFQTDYHAAGATLAVDYTAVESNTMVLADAEKLHRVMQNLLSNSLKYRDTQRPLCVSLVAESVPPFVHIVVADNGSGIAQTDLARVFDSFYRGDASRAGSANGHGLGLTIARQIITRHSGRIWIQSVEGTGTEVHIQLAATARKEG